MRASACFLRASADIELLVSSVVLITILFLSLSAMKIGVARLQTVHTAVVNVFHDATVEPTPQYLQDPSALNIDGIAVVRPGLPTRVHITHPSTTVKVTAGKDDTPSPAQIGATAALISPTWTFSCYPVTADQTIVEKWFTDYADESLSALRDPLGLAPSWTP